MATKLNREFAEGFAKGFDAMFTFFDNVTKSEICKECYYKDECYDMAKCEKILFNAICNELEIEVPTKTYPDMHMACVIGKEHTHE